jgi:hypothetical protein
MKKIIISLITISIALLPTFYSIGQVPPPPPNPGAGPCTTGGTAVGGSAPIDSGTWVLVLMAVAYGSSKLKKKDSSETDTLS